jgi:hypothetical protein
MRPYTRRIPEGLSLEDHRVLGDRLRMIRDALLAVRATVAAGQSSASPEYASCSRVLKELTSLETVLRLSAVGQHVDKRLLGELQRLYGETPQPKENVP